MVIMRAPRFQNKTYPSKILLFGEYTVLDESTALVCPFPSYFGSWKTAKHTDEALANFLLSLEGLNSKFELDTDLIKADIAQGICFDSNIKMGYGMGSSGALTAATLDRYYDVPSESNKLELKEALAHIENYFHGRSSGVDALAIYLNQSLVISTEQKINTCQLDWNFIKAHFFLVDTQLERKSQDLIKIYKTEISKSINLGLLKEHVSKAILATLAGKADEINKAIGHISEFQWDAFRAMIPSSIHPLWQEGLRDKKFSIKLLGAGGGGYALGFSNDLKALPANEQIIPF